MVKFKREMTSVVFEEVPDRVALAFNLTGCLNHCKGCHSPILRSDIGEELTVDIVREYVSQSYGVNCILFMGEGGDQEGLFYLAESVKSLGYEMAIYSGRDEVEPKMFELFDFVKVGSYKSELGGLNNVNTNQKMYYKGLDITEKFHKFWDV